MFTAHDSREPPLAPSSLPFVGHMLGLMKSKFNYYVDLSEQIDAPIFTVSLPGQNMYVVTKLSTVQKVQKMYKILAFPPIEAKFSATVCGISPSTQAILNHNVNGDEGDHGLSMKSYAAMREALKPGALLDDMNRGMVQEIVKSLDLLQPAKGETRKFGLYTWLRDSITITATRSIYGPMNPYEDKSVADAFCQRSPLAHRPQAHSSARTKVATAFEEYYKAGGIQNASALTQMRYQVSADHQVPLEDIARYEVGGSIAVLVNTAPSAFWTLLLLHSHPGLIDEIRKEIDACIVSSPSTADSSGDVVKTKTLDITALKEKCPLLLSSYQEGLRYTSMGTSVREVMEDTYLEGYLLKKGTMLQMPSRSIHLDANLWGPDVTQFNPRRFLPEEKKNRPSEACFRAFGGGKTLCHGRHFATNEILAVVAVFIVRFDMKPVGGDGWKLPSTLNTNVAAVVMQPDDDIEVEITNREGFDDVKWVISLYRSEKIFAMVTEDNEE